MIAGDIVDAFEPSLAAAPDGNGFTLAWIQRTRSNVHLAAAYCLLDSDLKPSTTMVLPNASGTFSAPPVVRSGKTTWITAGTSVWQIEADGSAPRPLEAGMNASDMTVATDFPQLVAARRQSVDTHKCGTAPGCLTFGRFSACRCPIFQDTYSLQFTALYQTSTAVSFDYGSDAKPAIGSDRRDVMLAWFNGAEANGGQVITVRLQTSSFSDFPQTVQQSQIIGSFSLGGGQTRPDIATDGERYVVVWRSAASQGLYDIVGASIDRAGKVLPLSIATSSADERDPSVVAVGKGRFLVAYEKNTTERHIAGRFVTFETRSHAVR